MAVAKFTHASDPGMSGALAAGGLNVFISAFRKDPGKGLGTSFALTGAAASAGWVLGSGGDGGLADIAAAVTAYGTTMGHLVASLSTNDPK
jgi:hypothetical protein